MAKYIINVPDEAVGFMDGEMSFFVEPKIKDERRRHYVLRIDVEDVSIYTEPDLSPLVDEAVQTIEDEVWELADYMCRMGVRERDSCFGFPLTTEVTANLSCQEAKAKYEAWLKQKDEIHVGDEVIPIDFNYDTMIVTRIWRDDHSRDCLDTLGLDGSICSFLTSNVKKTGRHFPEVAELLEKMRGEQDE